MAVRTFRTFRRLLDAIEREKCSIGGLNKTLQDLEPLFLFQDPEMDLTLDVTWQQVVKQLEDRLNLSYNTAQRLLMSYVYELRAVKKEISASDVQLDHVIHFHYAEHSSFLQCICTVFRISTDMSSRFHTTVNKAINSLLAKSFEGELKKQYRKSCSQTLSPQQESMAFTDKVLWADHVVSEQALLLEILFLLYFRSQFKASQLPEADSRSLEPTPGQFTELAELFQEQQFGKKQVLRTYISDRGRRKVNWISQLCVLIMIEALNLELLLSGWDEGQRNIRHIATTLEEHPLTAAGGESHVSLIEKLDKNFFGPWIQVRLGLPLLGPLLLAWGLFLDHLVSFLTLINHESHREPKYREYRVLAIQRVTYALDVDPLAELVHLLGRQVELTENTKPKLRTFSSQIKDQKSSETFSMLDSVSVWAPQTSDAYQWIQIDLSLDKLVLGVVTQGRPDSAQWVTKYKVQYRTASGTTWTWVDNEREFAGNHDGCTKMENRFSSPLSARFIRLVPVRWNQQIAMRVAVLTGGSSKHAAHSLQAEAQGTSSSLPCYKAVIKGLLWSLFQSDYYHRFFKPSPQSVASDPTLDKKLLEKEEWRQQQTPKIHAILCGIAEGEASICLEFWERDVQSDDFRPPIYDEALALFPIHIAPLLNLLISLSAQPVSGMPEDDLLHVCCIKCNQWRRLPDNCQRDLLLSEGFKCSLNPDPECTSCSFPEDSTVDIQLRKCARYVFQALACMARYTAVTDSSTHLDITGDYVRLTQPWVSSDGVIVPQNGVGQRLALNSNREEAVVQFHRTWSAWPLLIRKLKDNMSTLFRRPGIVFEGVPAWKELKATVNCIYSIVACDFSLFLHLSRELSAAKGYAQSFKQKDDLTSLMFQLLHSLAARFLTNRSTSSESDTSPSFATGVDLDLLRSCVGILVVSASLNVKNFMNSLAENWTFSGQGKPLTFVKIASVLMKQIDGTPGAYPVTSGILRILSLIIMQRVRWIETTSMAVETQKEYSQEEALLFAALASKWEEPPRDRLDDLVLANAKLSALKYAKQIQYKPFSMQKRWAEAVVRWPRLQRACFKVARGAPHVVFKELLTSDAMSAVVRTATQVVEALEARGIQVLVVVRTDTAEDQDWYLVGLLAFLDPVQNDSGATLIELERAGSDVKMWGLITPRSAFPHDPAVDVTSLLSWISNSVFVGYQSWLYQSAAERWQVGSRILMLYIDILVGPSGHTSEAPTPRDILVRGILSEQSIHQALLRPLVQGYAVGRELFSEQKTQDLEALEDFLTETFIFLSHLLKIELAENTESREGIQTERNLSQLILDWGEMAPLPVGAAAGNLVQSMVEYVIEGGMYVCPPPLRCAAYDTLALLCRAAQTISGYLGTMGQVLSKACTKVLLSPSENSKIKLSVLRLLGSIFRFQAGLAERFISWCDSSDGVPDSKHTADSSESKHEPDGDLSSSFAGPSGVMGALLQVMTQKSDTFETQPEILAACMDILVSVWEGHRKVAKILTEEKNDFWSLVTEPLKTPLRIPKIQAWKSPKGSSTSISLSNTTTDIFVQQTIVRCLAMHLVIMEVYLSEPGKLGALRSILMGLIDPSHNGGASGLPWHVEFLTQISSLSDEPDLPRRLAKVAHRNGFRLPLPCLHQLGSISLSLYDLPRLDILMKRELILSREYLQVYYETSLFYGQESVCGLISRWAQMWSVSAAKLQMLNAWRSFLSVLLSKHPQYAAAGDNHPRPFIWRVVRQLSEALVALSGHISDNVIKTTIEISNVLFLVLGQTTKGSGKDCILQASLQCAVSDSYRHDPSPSVRSSSTSAHTGFGDPSAGTLIVTGKVSAETMAVDMVCNVMDAAITISESVFLKDSRETGEEDWTRRPSKRSRKPVDDVPQWLPALKALLGSTLFLLRWLQASDGALVSAEASQRVLTSCVRLVPTVSAGLASPVEWDLAAFSGALLPVMLASIDGRGELALSQAITKVLPKLLCSFSAASQPEDANRSLSLLMGLATRTWGASLLIQQSLMLFLCNAPWLQIKRSNLVLRPYIGAAGSTKRNPWHEVWCSILRLVTTVLRTLGPQSEKTILQALEFFQAYEGRMVGAMRDPEITLGRLEEVERISSLLFELERIGGSHQRTRRTVTSSLQGTLHVVKVYAELLADPHKLSRRAKLMSWEEQHTMDSSEPWVSLADSDAESLVLAASPAAPLLLPPPSNLEAPTTAPSLSKASEASPIAKKGMRFSHRVEMSICTNLRNCLSFLRLLTRPSHCNLFQGTQAQPSASLLFGAPIRISQNYELAKFSDTLPVSESIEERPSLYVLHSISKYCLKALGAPRVQPQGSAAGGTGSFNPDGERELILYLLEHSLYLLYFHACQHAKLHLPFAKKRVDSAEKMQGRRFAEAPRVVPEIGVTEDSTELMHAYRDQLDSLRKQALDVLGKVSQENLVFLNAVLILLGKFCNYIEQTLQGAMPGVTEARGSNQVLRVDRGNNSPTSLTIQAKRGIGLWLSLNKRDRSLYTSISQSSSWLG
eukprot:g82642.t1